MRAVLQRVRRAEVVVAAQTIGAIGPGFLVLLGIGPEDTVEDRQWLAGKIRRLRVFPDAAGKMNLDVVQAGGQVLVVSQFTLFAQCTGNRPSFTAAAPPAMAIPHYEGFLADMERELAAPVSRGVFGADMQVSLVNDGPVTILLDSRERSGSP
jgi:D-tyrosyl-tRNA(Tyr) deacylase